MNSGIDMNSLRHFLAEPVRKVSFIWEKDNPILGYASEEDRTNDLPCANAIIFQIRRVGEFEIVVVVSLSRAGEDSEIFDNILKTKKPYFSSPTPFVCLRTTFGVMGKTPPFH